MQETEVRVLAGEPYLHTVRYILLNFTRFLAQKVTQAEAIIITSGVIKVSRSDNKTIG